MFIGVFTIRHVHWCVHQEKVTTYVSAHDADLEEPTNEPIHVPQLTYPRLCILKHNLPLCPSDEVIGQSCAFHNVIHFVVLEGYCQLDVALELTFGLADRTFGATTAMTRPTAKSTKTRDDNYTASLMREFCSRLSSCTMTGATRHTLHVHMGTMVMVAMVMVAMVTVTMTVTVVMVVVVDVWAEDTPSSSAVGASYLMRNTMNSKCQNHT